MIRYFKQYSNRCVQINQLYEYYYLHGSKALDSGKYWQTTQSCSPDTFHIPESPPVGQTSVLPGPPWTGSANASEIWLLSSYPGGFPVAKYNCWKHEEQ